MDEEYPGDKGRAEKDAWIDFWELFLYLFGVKKAPKEILRSLDFIGFNSNYSIFDFLEPK